MSYDEWFLTAPGRAAHNEAAYAELMGTKTPDEALRDYLREYERAKQEYLRRPSDG